jgi:hypothetical protein
MPEFVADYGRRLDLRIHAVLQRRAVTGNFLQRRLATLAGPFLGAAKAIAEIARYNTVC